MFGPIQTTGLLGNFDDNVEATFRDNAAVGSILWMLAA